MHLLIPGRTDGRLFAVQAGDIDFESADPPFLSAHPHAPLSRLRPPCFCSLVPSYKFPFKLPHKQLESPRKKLSCRRKTWTEERKHNTKRKTDKAYPPSETTALFMICCAMAIFFLLEASAYEENCLSNVVLWPLLLMFFVFSARRWQHLTDQMFFLPCALCGHQTTSFLSCNKPTEHWQTLCTPSIFLCNTQLWFLHPLSSSPTPSESHRVPSLLSLPLHPLRLLPHRLPSANLSVSPHLSVAPSLLPRPFTHLSRRSALLSAQTDCGLYSRQPEGPTLFQSRPWRGKGSFFFLTITHPISTINNIWRVTQTANGYTLSPWLIV